MRTDSELLDALEQFVEKEPLTLWYGDGQFPGGRTSGLSLLGGMRSLRKALDQGCPATDAGEAGGVK